MDSDFSNEPYWMKISALTLNSLFFATFILAEIFGLRRINFKIEKSGIILLAAYSVTMCQRLIFDAIRLTIDQ